MSKKTRIPSDAQARRGVSDTQFRRLASDAQARARHSLSDMQTQRVAADLQSLRGAGRLPRQLRSDAQSHVTEGVRGLLIERQESVARVHEARAELALAKGAIARIDARLLEAGYYPPEDE
jgi:hypothetical protein